ncbi:hypothetical protein X777_16445 [Ooceraea biroi]|uniref:Uncharacterized protein n=1 Tax=Ooceraea biroi TaxID=2015173 RepID=A0A026VU10_OOCBI|nr:hypothetical protein X777_16445 [Ooceraea biroi]
MESCSGWRGWEEEEDWNDDIEIPYGGNSQTKEWDEEEWVAWVEENWDDDIVFLCERKRMRFTEEDDEECEEESEDESEEESKECEEECEEESEEESEESEETEEERH